MSERKRTLHNTAHSTAATWTEFFLGMLVSIIIARHLMPIEYGQFSFMMWCATLFVILANGGLTTGAIKFIAESGPAQQRSRVVRYLSRLQRLFLLTASLLALTAGLIFPHFFTDTAPTLLWLLVLFASLFKASYIFRMSCNKGREDFAAITRVILLVAPLNLLINGVAAWLAPSLTAFLWVYLATSIAYLLCMAWFDQQSVENKPLDNELKRRIWRHIRVTSGSIILSFLVLRQSEVFFLKLLSGAEQIGFFNIAFTIGFALSALIPGVYSSLLLPMMARQSNDGAMLRSKQFHASLRYLQLLAIPMAFGTFALGKTLVSLLYGSAYSAAGDTLLWIISGISLAAIGQAGVSLLVSGDQQWRVLRINMVVLAIVLAVDWWAIHNWGLAGAGAAFVFGNLLHSLLMLRYALQQLNSRWHWPATLRTLTVGAAAYIVTMVFMNLTTPFIPASALLLAGALLFSITYLPFSILIGCWNADELHFLATLSQRLPTPIRLTITTLIERSQRN